MCCFTDFNSVSNHLAYRIILVYTQHSCPSYSTVTGYQLTRVSPYNLWCLENIQYHTYEPAQEIMALFVLHKLILQTRMRKHPMGLNVWILVGPFVYFHTPRVRTAKALARLHKCDMYHNLMSWLISWFHILGRKTLFLSSRTKFVNWHCYSVRLFLQFWIVQTVSSVHV